MFQNKINKNGVEKRIIRHSTSLNQISFLANETFKNNNFIIKENEALKKKYAALKNKFNTVEQTTLDDTSRKLVSFLLKSHSFIDPV